MGNKPSSVRVVPTETIKQQPQPETEKADNFHLKVDVQPPSPKTPEQTTASEAPTAKSGTDHVMSLVDPRSPTIEYSRTPIHVVRLVKLGQN